MLVPWLAVVWTTKWVDQVLPPLVERLTATAFAASVRSNAMLAYQNVPFGPDTTPGAAVGPAAAGVAGGEVRPLVAGVVAARGPWLWAGSHDRANGVCGELNAVATVADATTAPSAAGIAAASRRAGVRTVFENLLSM